MLNFYFTGMIVFTITLSRGYGETNFREDLKKLFIQLGVEKKRTVFIFTAAQIAEEGMKIYFIKHYS